MFGGEKVTISHYKSVHMWYNNPKFFAPTIIKNLKFENSQNFPQKIFWNFPQKIFWNLDYKIFSDL